MVSYVKPCHQRRARVARTSVRAPRWPCQHRNHTSSSQARTCELSGYHHAPATMYHAHEM